MKTLTLALACWLLAGLAAAADKTIIRIGAQAYGTVDWELSALEARPDAAFAVEVHPLANAEAAKVALQAGAVDVIVADWLWAAKLRGDGHDYVFYPYSETSGALVVANASPIRGIADLAGKKLGVAGGELDKNWLLLRALADKRHIDLAATQTTYAAPPLINEQLARQRLDAALTYWHFAARLQAQGFREVINGKGILAGLGFTATPPALGYVFRQGWAQANKAAINQFLAASKDAKERLCASDAAWQAVLPKTQTDDAATQAKLRQGYCEGGVEQWTATEQQAIAQLHALLHGLNPQLTGAAELPAGLFWPAD